MARFRGPVEILSSIAALTIPAAIVYAWRRKALLSLAFAVAILGVFILGEIAGTLGPAAGRQFTLDLAVWEDREGDLFGSGAVHSSPLTYVTMMFVHANFLHLLFNLVFLILMGPMLEERIGSPRWGVLYFAGGLVATFVFEVIHWPDPAYILVGASGALSAVFGALGRLYPRERISMWIPLPVPVPFPPQPVIYWVVGFIIVQFVLWAINFGNLLSGVAVEAHIAGLAFGFAMAPAVMRIPSKKGGERKRIRDFSVLKPLAVGRELDEMYGMLVKETLPEAQDAWLEKFAAKAPCPKCGKPLRYRRGALRSECGWKLRVP